MVTERSNPVGQDVIVRDSIPVGSDDSNIIKGPGSSSGGDTSEDGGGNAGDGSSSGSPAWVGRHGPTSSLFKQRIAASGLGTPSKAEVSTDSPKNKLGTVSFFSNVTNSASPRLNIFSPGNHRQRPVVETEEGKTVPYDEWWPKMQRESKTPIKMGGLSYEESILSSLKSSGIGLFSSSPAPQPVSSSDSTTTSSDSDKPSPKCQLLQKKIEEMTLERHRKLLQINVTVSIPTLKRAIEKMNGGGDAEGSTRAELVEEYLALARAPEEDWEEEEEEEEEEEIY